MQTVQQHANKFQNAPTEIEIDRHQQPRLEAQQQEEETGDSEPRVVDATNANNEPLELMNEDETLQCT